MHTIRGEGIRDQRCRSCIRPVQDDEHAPCGSTEDESCNTAKLESTYLAEDIQTIVRVGLVDRKCTADDLNLVREACIGDVCAASRYIFGSQLQKCCDNRGTRCCVRNAHLTGEDAAVAAIGTVICDGYARLYGSDCLCTRHGGALCHIRRAACDTVMTKSWDVRAVRIHPEVGDDEARARIVCGGIRCAAACDKIVAHHVECGLGWVCTDALCGDAVVGAGDDDARLRGRGMTILCDSDIAQEGIIQPPEVHICLCVQRSGSRLANFHIGHIDGGYGLFEEVHARAFSFSMRFRESPIRPRSSSMLMIMTSRESPTESRSSG